MQLLEIDPRVGIVLVPVHPLYYQVHNATMLCQSRRRWRARGGARRRTAPPTAPHRIRLRPSLLPWLDASFECSIVDEEHRERARRQELGERERMQIRGLRDLRNNKTMDRIHGPAQRIWAAFRR
ncbi:hypothetical protein SETIT_3G045900v2 [Setaria italica]|uniref:Uncharacterized protein n=1 Tax=Setaria italica TaxID=4555 RepID=A0A368QBM7_SETIT|nr:hypothetical protein SETIT_3G045900v2 [Setaria italica]